jgi:hypothetical protein
MDRWISSTREAEAAMARPAGNYEEILGYLEVDRS